jgi:hypothetical protein
MELFDSESRAFPMEIPSMRAQSRLSLRYSELLAQLCARTYEYGVETLSSHTFRSSKFELGLREVFSTPIDGYSRTR